MPNLNNLENKSFTRTDRGDLVNVRRGEILHREDLRAGYFYALIGITVSLAVAGTLYTVGKKLLA